MILERGEKYGQLTVLEKRGQRYRCACSCGFSKEKYKALALTRAGGVTKCSRCRKAELSVQRQEREMSETNTLDWAKLEQFIAERKPVEVSAGILDDWYWTAATVYEDGEWKDRDRPYVTSYWATPGFKATLANGDVIEVAASTIETPEQAEARKVRREKSMQELREITAKLEAKQS